MVRVEGIDWSMADSHVDPERPELNRKTVLSSLAASLKSRERKLADNCRSEFLML